MSAVGMTVAAEGAAAQTQRAASNDWARLARPALGLVLPVTLAAGVGIRRAHGLGERPLGAAAVGDLCGVC